MKIHAIDEPLTRPLNLDALLDPKAPGRSARLRPTNCHGEGRRTG
jgi:hypothetical protein